MSKTLLITGANRGIGFEMTKQAAERGDHVIACARNVMEAPNLVALARDNPAISLLGLDVAAEADNETNRRWHDPQDRHSGL